MDELDKAMTFICYNRSGGYIESASLRQHNARRYAYDMLSEEAATILYYELLRRPLLSDEANLLAELAERLGRPVIWSHTNLYPNDPTAQSGRAINIMKG